MNDPVLVTTEFRGVFFGDLLSYDAAARVARLKDAQNCIYWSKDVAGVFGLAASGPDKNCRIGPIIKSLLLERVTSISECSDKAVNAWREQPWK